MNRFVRNEVTMQVSVTKKVIGKTCHNKSCAAISRKITHPVIFFNYFSNSSLNVKDIVERQHCDNRL